MASNRLKHGLSWNNGFGVGVAAFDVPLCWEDFAQCNNEWEAWWEILSGEGTQRQPVGEHPDRCLDSPGLEQTEALVDLGCDAKYKARTIYSSGSQA